LADLPSKEELVGKFLFLLNHPISSFARVLNAIAEKQADGSEVTAEAPVAEEVAETPKAEEAPVAEATEE
jgi:large subunit ribosomal protein L10